MSVETILQDIDREITSLTQARSVLAGLGNHSNATRAVAASTGRTSRFSASARRKMAAAQKARWAKYRATKQKTATAKPIRIISAGARRKMAAAQKARWNAYRAGKAKKAA
jgi:hypothetical protein